MDGAGAAWILGGYAVGTFPSTWIVARIHRVEAYDASVDRGRGEADAHVMAARHLGWGWAAAAAAADVLKGVLWMLAVTRLGDQPAAVVAWTGLAVVAGHAFPPFARDFAGRGLAAAAGVFLVVLPVEMVVAGVVILAGSALRVGGVASTIALVGVPIVAALEGQPWPYVAMAVGILLLILVRRLQGVGEAVAGGAPAGRAVWYRVAFDTTGPPRRGR